MSSNINPNNINGNFPVAGQDNDSQGFRDNFTNILNNFSFASSEITDLQNAVTNLQETVAANGNVTAYYGNVTQSLTVGGTIYGNVVGDIYTVSGTKVIDNGTTGYDATFTGNVNGNAVVGSANVTTKLNMAGITSFSGGYQYYAPTTNFTLAVYGNVSRVILDPTGVITNGAINLPSGNVDAQTISISSTYNVTNLQVNPNSGTTLVPGANITLTGGSGVTYFYHATEAKWYKVG